MESRLPLSLKTNTSKLPQPGKKRARSPEEAAPPGKKGRLDDVKPILQKAKSSTSLRRQVSGTKRPAPTVPRPTAPRPTAPRPTAIGALKMPSKSVTNMPPPTKTKPPGSTTIASSAKPSISSNSSTGGKKSRPAWDLKGRLQDMEVYMRRQTQESSSLSSQLQDYNGRIALLEGQNEKLHGDVMEKEMASDTAMKEIEELTSKLRKAEDDFLEEKRRLTSEIDNLKEQKSFVDRQKANVEAELESVTKEKAALKNSMTELIAAQSSIKAQLESVKILLEAAQRDVQSRDLKIQEQMTAIQNKESSIEMLEQESREHETERRKLHNTIQELKGNIRVFCRVRPLLGDEGLGRDGVSHINFPDLDHKVLEMDRIGEMSVNESMLNSTRGGRQGSKYEFTFDKVFQPDNSQADVFTEISHLVQSSLDGYNVCIFAYGQTGSGKTHTMEGNLSDPASLGMIPRAVRQIFSTASDLQTKGWQYKFEASMLEIYNETIRDLLAKSKDDKYEIKMSGKTGGEVYVSNLNVVNVTKEDQVLSLLHKAYVNRSVAETKCNERSSRSHSVFQMKMTGTNEMTGETCQGSLNLIDLAGSERVKDSGSEGQRLVEAQCINKSLSNLGNVIMALGNKDKHIPYRNSKLTYLLQNSLGGNSKTLMFVNVSPKEECFGETLNSLRFATKVNQCHVGTAQKKK